MSQERCRRTVLSNARGAPVRLYTEFQFNKPIHSLVSAIAVDPANTGVIAFNLEHDPSELLNIGDESLRKWVLSSPRPLRVIKANGAPILLDIDKAPGRADLMKIGEPEINRRAQLLQDSPELRHRLLKAYAETREVYEESPWLEEQIYRGFPGGKDSSLMREFHNSSWPERVEIAERFEDDRYRKIARRIVYNLRPDLLDEEVRKTFDAAIGRRWLTEGKAKWLTIERALGELEGRREGCSYKEKLLLEGLESYLKERLAWAKAHVPQ